LGVYRDGRIVYARGYGMANLEKQVPISATSLFDIGSTSKQFTAASILLLAQDGKLGLEDDVRKFIPELPQLDRPVTIRHLLHHTSGMRDYISLLMLAGADDEGRTTARQALDAIARQRALNFEPGSDHLYSNTGYFLLSQIVERVSKQSLNDFATARIFKPLGMNATYFRDGSRPDPATRATGYAPTRESGFRVYMSEWEQTGDGAVHTSIEDLQRWDENFYHAKVGGRVLIEALQQVDTLTSGAPLTYARGLSVDQYKGLQRVSHGGAWAGYRADLMRIPSRHLSAAVLCNRADANPTAYASQVLDIYLGDGVASAAPAATPTAPVRVQATDAELRRWVGRYRNFVTGTMRPVVLEEGKLLAQFGNLRQELVPTGPAEFAVALGGNTLTLRFEGDAGARRMRQFANGREVAVFEELTDIAVSDADRTALAGSYQSDELQTTFTIEQNGTALALAAAGNKFPMQPLRADIWSAGPFTVRVTRDAQQRITGFLLDQGRARGMVFKRVP
jgi:CubicO group peptidase (beta-lactamase class C family)